MIEPRRRVVKKGNCYYPQRAVWMFYRCFRDKNGEILCFRSLEEAQRVCWDDADKEKFERRQKQKVFYCD